MSQCYFVWGVHKENNPATQGDLSQRSSKGRVEMMVHNGGRKKMPELSIVKLLAAAAGTLRTEHVARHTGGKEGRGDFSRSYVGLSIQSSALILQCGNK